MLSFAPADFRTNPPTTPLPGTGRPASWRQNGKQWWPQRSWNHCSHPVAKWHEPSALKKKPNPLYTAPRTQKKTYFKNALKNPTVCQLFLHPFFLGEVSACLWCCHRIMTPLTLHGSSARPPELEPWNQASPSRSREVRWGFTEKKTNLTRTGRSKHTWCLGFLDQIFLWVWKICSKHGLEKDLFLQVEKKNREGYQCCNSICKVGEIFQLTSATKHPCASPERCRKCPTLTESPKYSVKLCPISIPSSRTTPPVRKCVLCQSDLTSSEHFQNCKPSLSIHDAEQQAGNYTAATTPRISELLVPTIQSRTG